MCRFVCRTFELSDSFDLIDIDIWHTMHFAVFDAVMVRVSPNLFSASTAL